MVYLLDINDGVVIAEVGEDLSEGAYSLILDFAKSQGMNPVLTINPKAWQVN